MLEAAKERLALFLTDDQEQRLELHGLTKLERKELHQTLEHYRCDTYSEGLEPNRVLIVTKSVDYAGIGPDGLDLLDGGAKPLNGRNAWLAQYYGAKNTKKTGGIIAPELITNNQAARDKKNEYLRGLIETERNLLLNTRYVHRGKIENVRKLINGLGLANTPATSPNQTVGMIEGAGEAMAAVLKEIEQSGAYSNASPGPGRFVAASPAILHVLFQEYMVGRTKIKIEELRPRVNAICEDSMDSQIVKGVEERFGYIALGYLSRAGYLKKCKFEKSEAYSLTEEGIRVWRMIAPDLPPLPVPPVPVPTAHNMNANAAAPLVEATTKRKRSTKVTHAQTMGGMAHATAAPQKQRKTSSDDVSSSLEANYLKEGDRLVGANPFANPMNIQRTDLCVLIDHRELGGEAHKIHLIKQLFQNENVKHEVSYLPIGDYMIVLNGMYVLPFVAERKSLHDLAASYEDGRYASQIANMIALKQRLPGINLFYIIEGSWQIYGPRCMNEGHGQKSVERMIKEIPKIFQKIIMDSPSDPITDYLLWIVGQYEEFFLQLREGTLNESGLVTMQEFTKIAKEILKANKQASSSLSVSLSPNGSSNNNFAGLLDIAPHSPLPVMMSASRPASTNTSPTSLAPNSVSNNNSPTTLVPKTLSNNNSPTSLAPNSVSNNNSPTSLALNSVSNNNSPTTLVPKTLSNNNSPALTQSLLEMSDDSSESDGYILSVKSSPKRHSSIMLLKDETLPTPEPSLKKSTDRMEVEPSSAIVTNSNNNSPPVPPLKQTSSTINLLEPDEPLFLDASEEDDNSTQEYKADIQPILSDAQWTCAMCTLLNPATVSLCSVCNSPRC